jgi:LysM repeat protein
MVDYRPESRRGHNGRLSAASAEPIVAAVRDLHAIGIAAFAFLTSSCTASLPPEGVPVATRPEPAESAAPAEESLPVVVHVVTPGQTLWRIARAYGVDLARLAETNGIGDPARVEVGSSIRIPGARYPIDVPPYPMPIPPPPELEETFARETESSGLLWPVDGGEILSAFGVRRGRERRHEGLDIRGAPGQEILAARAGRVAFSGTQRGYGHVVILDHGDGMETVYAHAHTLLAKEGDSVERGQPIARVGRSGNASTHHLHFEVRLDGRPIDPFPRFQSIAEVRP